ncbi:MAG: pilus assembly protein [Candidatus Wallbacteria bacterium]|nr:pilus assembly protein [Candidatus Wallbacteria bacterium]
MRKRRNGQSIVEAALVLPLILLVVFGIIEFGRLFNHKLTLNYAVNEGAKAAAYRSAPDTITGIIENSITGFSIEPGNIMITYKDSSGGEMAPFFTSDNKVYFANESMEVFVDILVKYNYEPIAPYPTITETGFLLLESRAYVKVQ